MFLMRSVGVMPSALFHTRAENEKGRLAHLHRVGVTRRATSRDIMRALTCSKQPGQLLARERANWKFRSRRVCRQRFQRHGDALTGCLVRRSSPLKPNKITQPLNAQMKFKPLVANIGCLSSVKRLQFTYSYACSTLHQKCSLLALGTHEKRKAW